MLKRMISFFILLVSLPTFGLQLVPSSYELAPSGSLASRVFEVVNDSKEIIGIQVSILTREWSSEQEEINLPTSAFTIFPTQLILQPGEKKGVRARWKGDKKLLTEQAYRLLVQQLPVSFSKEKKGSAVKVLHKVVGALYVTPNNAKHDLKIGKATKQYLELNAKTRKKGHFLVFDVSNTGSKHVLLAKAGLVAKGKQNVALTHQLLAPLKTSNVLAGATLHVQLPWPEELGDVVDAVKSP